MRRAGSPSVCVLLALAAGMASCEPESRVVAVRGMLHGLPGATSPLDAEAERNAAESRDPPPDAAPLELGKDGRPKNPLRTEHEDGTVTLVSQSPRHVIIHLRETLLSDETDLLFEQVLSERTKQAYRDRGLDPHEAVTFLVAHKADVLRLLNKMPQGELTPGLFLKPVGDNVYRLEVPPSDGRMAFRKMDFLWEWGVCRLVLIS